MGHTTNERRYPPATRLESCPDCGAVWALLSTGAILWRAACCPLCKDGPALGRKRVLARMCREAFADIDDALADRYFAEGMLSKGAHKAIKRTIETTRKIARRGRP